MSEKKNIDTFFKEHLEGYNVTPPEMAWKNIEAKLKEKEEKRRVVPFWWKFSGIAASLLIGFIVYDGYFNSDSKINKTVVDQNNDQSIKKQNDKNSKEINILSPKESVVLNQENTINSEVSAKEKSASSYKNSENKSVGILKTNPSKNRSKKTTTINTSNELVSKAEASNSNSNNRHLNNQNQIVEKTNVQKEGTSIPLNSNNSTKIITIEPNKNTAVNDLAKDKNTIDPTEKIEKKLEEIKKIDSTKLADVEPNALEELLKEKEKKFAKGQKINRWQVTPNIAPIYFSSISNGSPLDEKLESNQKVYGTNYSYGLAFNYNLNKKINIRTGVNTFSVDYDTKQIVFYQNANASRMQNVNPNLQGSLIQIDPLNNVNSSFSRIINERFEGSLNQKMAYIEIPLEASYKLISKKFGLDVIGGISTLFLSQNDVYLNSTGFNLKIGEANNLNNINFSTNIGFGMKYSFLKRFDARIEPLFKYQLNTFSSGAGNFKPYVFGVYSGISYHF